ncbi:hypothetical protein D8855_00005 [Streptococcus mitis]|uniref:Competence-specific sigma factor ComX n=1 Tax=Streptococcus mitis TaxID=28037 RepID=A0A3R9KHC1_STRMT|nr:hypothetical protein D8855_00005 [Streptococcus mitis]
MFKELYEEVQGIVYKCRNEYYLHLWDLSDWDQEGMICLHELIMKKSKGLYISVEMNITFIYGIYRIGTKRV